jgi:acetyltransferase-like isoleucine patch superfamily enzyme
VKSKLYVKEELHSSPLVVRILHSKLAHRGKVLNWALKKEGGMFFSHSFRDYLFRTRQIELGSYSYGIVIDLLNFPVKTVIGRYTSIGPGVKIFQANHPSGFLSMHPFFYRSDIGVAKGESIQRNQLFVGHDVWIGANAIICPGCHRIGNGSIIAAGAVVTKNVPDFSVIGGNPAMVIKKRFEDELATKITSSGWWFQPYEVLKKFSRELTRNLRDNDIDELLTRLQCCGLIND